VFECLFCTFFLNFNFLLCPEVILLEPKWLFFWDLPCVWNLPWILCSESTSSFLQAHKACRPPARLCKASCNWDHILQKGLGENSVTDLFLCNWLVFLTTCEPYTAKPPGYTTHPGGISSSPDTDHGSGFWELISLESASIIKFLLPGKVVSVTFFTHHFPQHFSFTSLELSCSSTVCNGWVGADLLGTKRHTRNGVYISGRELACVRPWFTLQKHTYKDTQKSI
jgi:hypothetical protein